MLTFESFKNADTLTLENECIVNSFLQLHCNALNPVFYHCLPVYNTFTKSSNFKFKIFTVNKDSIFVYYKVIQIVKTKQIRVFNMPISKNLNSENERLIYKQLRDLPFIRFCFNENYANEFLTSDRLFEYDDYFLNTDKHGINHKITGFLNNSKFSYKILHKCFDSKIMKLYNQWENEMIACGYHPSKSSKKEFINFISYDNPNIYNVILYYKDKPISIRTIILTPFGYANAVFFKTLRHVTADTIEDEKILKYRLRNVQNYLVLKLIKEHGINRLYVAGCRPNEKRLIKHKQMSTDGVLKYYIN